MLFICMLDGLRKAPPLLTRIREDPLRPVGAVSGATQVPEGPGGRK